MQLPLDRLFRKESSEQKQHSKGEDAGLSNDEGVIRKEIGERQIYENPQIAIEDRNNNNNSQDNKRYLQRSNFDCNKGEYARQEHRNIKDASDDEINHIERFKVFPIAINCVVTYCIDTDIKRVDAESEQTDACDDQEYDPNHIQA